MTIAGHAPTLNRDQALRLHRALTGSSDDLFQVVQESSSEVLLAAIKNPALSEDHLLALLKRRDLKEEIPKAIYSSQRLELTHRLRVALVSNPATATQIALTLLPHLHLFELVTLLSLPGSTPDQKVAAEREITRRLPTTPLGSLKTLARRATHTIAAEILKAGNPETVAICLSNPRLKEVAILQFLNSGRASPESISQVARHPRWKGRERLKMAILKQPKTPGIWHTLWLPKLKSPQLSELKASRRLSPPGKKVLEEELRKRAGQRPK